MPTDYTDPGYPAPEGGAAGPFGQAAAGGPYPVMPLALLNAQAVSPWAMRRRRFGAQAAPITPQFQGEAGGGWASATGGLMGKTQGWGANLGGTVRDPGSAMQSPIMQMLLGQATQNAQGMQRQYDLAADVYGGGDPILRAYAALQGRLQGSGDISQALSNAYLQQLLGGQDYARRYALQQLIGQQQLQVAKASKGGSSAGDILGQIFGTGAGALLGKL